jgi:hypothetical protein
MGEIGERLTLSLRSRLCNGCPHIGSNLLSRDRKGAVAGWCNHEEIPRSVKHKGTC